MHPSKKLITPFPLLFLLTLFLASLLTTSFSDNQNRQALEIIIGGGGGGGGGGSNPPPDTPCPPPPLPPPPKLPPPLTPHPPWKPPVHKPPPKKPPVHKPPPKKPPPKNPPLGPLNFVSEEIEHVYYVIQRFKKRITSDPFNITKTWVGPKVCNYKGFFCDSLIRNNHTALAGVKFNGYKFNGPELILPGFLDELPDIIVFHANSNFLRGGIPPAITKRVPFLFELDLSNNNYTGSFPREILNAKQLTFLDLRFNSFAGQVPQSVFTLDVDVLFINNNGFFQKIPDTLGSTPALYVTLANNLFTGSIPPTIGNLSKTLLEILLLNNSLSGCLPLEIGYLEKTTLFDASTNSLTGPIPQSFGCLGKMESLNLANNKLFGTVPEAVCNLPNLSNLSLSGNYFNKVGPACQKLMECNVLDVRGNCIQGMPGQRSQAECTAFLRRANRHCYDGRWFHWTPCGGKGRRNLLELPGSGSGSDSGSGSGGPRVYEALNPWIRGVIN